MIPGHANVLICPVCGGEKEVLSLISGNTIGGQQWSDTRALYPMLPQVSPVQKCPCCGKYYFTKDAERRKSNHDFFDTGDLTYSQLKEAAAQFGDELSTEKRQTLNLRLLWAYNDLYNREGFNCVRAPDEEKAYIDSVLDELIASDAFDGIIEAEFLRERGRFDDADLLLAICVPQDEFLKKIVDRMASLVKQDSSIVFKI